MKICILTHDENTAAGWGRYSDHVIGGLRARGHEVIVLTEYGGSFPILRRGRGVFASALKIIPILRRCDIVHALDVYPFGIIAFLANIIAGKPLVFTAQGTYSIAPLYHQWWSFFARRACASARAIIAISRYTENRIKEAVPHAKTVVINHGIILENWTTHEAREVPIPHLVSVGALKRRKGYHIALEAFARARERIPELSYTIIGNQSDAGYVEELKKIISQRGMQGVVTLKEGLTDREILQEYKNAGVFLLPSVNIGNHFEGFGLVFLEAAAAGLPVIGTTGNGISDAVSSENGVLVPQNDVSATADAIVHVLSDVAYWKSLSRHSSIWAQQHSAARMLDEYLGVYSRIT